MEPNELPAGLRDWPSDGWPMFAPYPELIPVPVRVGRVDVPQVFHTTITPDDDSWVLTLLYSVDAEEQQILFSGALAGGAELPDLLERVKAERSLRWWQRRALLFVVADVSERAAEYLFDEDEDYTDQFAGNSPVDLTKILSDKRTHWKRQQQNEAHRTILGRRRNRVTREFLAEVAETYRQAFAAGEPPTQAVADRYGRPHSTAAHWVSRARKAELLGPADGSRGGELR